MMRPDFKDIHSFEEFSKYYWYQKELANICKSLKIEDKGTKQELNNYIKEYFSGNMIKKKSRVKVLKSDSNITLSTPLLECGFAFNTKFREYFSNITGISNFKFTADMATAWRIVKKDNDIKFTIQDLLDIYYGKSNYAKYDNSACQWNKFLKDFCNDVISGEYIDKLKVASILWNEVKSSKEEKTYSRELLNNNLDKIKAYKKFSS